MSEHPEFTHQMYRALSDAHKRLAQTIALLTDPDNSWLKHSYTCERYGNTTFVCTCGLDEVLTAHAEGRLPNLGDDWFGR